MPLPKMGGKKKVCGNGIAKIEGEKCGNEFVAMTLPKQEETKIWLQLVCGNGIVEIEGKKKWQLICGNGIAEMGGEKNGLWQWHCRNRGERYKKKYAY